MTENWYDEGIGSEKLKRDIAQSALDNPVTPGPCICCDKVEKLQAKLDDAESSGGFWGRSCARLVKKNKLLEQILSSYHIQFDAAMEATSLGLCKRVIKHALEDEQSLKGT